MRSSIIAVMLASARRSRNLLLGSLSAEDFDFLEPSLERVPLHADEVVLKANSAIERIYFPESGIVSIHEVLRDGTRVGVAIIGFEGLTGWSALLGFDHSPQEAAIAVGGGTALSIAPDQLLRACLERHAINVCFYATCNASSARWAGRFYPTCAIL